MEDLGKINTIGYKSGAYLTWASLYEDVAAIRESSPISLTAAIDELIIEYYSIAYNAAELLKLGL